MELFIEYVLLDNLVMNFIIIRFIEFTFRVIITNGRKFLGLLVGSILTIFMPYFLQFGLIVYLYKFITSVAIVLMLKRYCGFKHFIKYYIFFVAYTFLLGGIVIGVIGALDIDYSFNGVIIYDFEFPISIFVIVLSATIWLLKKMAIALKEQVRSANYLCNVVLIDGDTRVEATGFMDSGNKVERNGESVNIISLDLFMKLHREISIKKLLYQTIGQEELKDMSYINIGGLSFGKKYLAFKIDNMIVNDKELKSPVLAVAMKNFDAFDCILNSKFLGVENE